jgi:hypothetical protein
MNTKDLLQITVVATGTATLAVMTFLAGPLDAGSGTDPNGTTIPKPKLTAKGVEFTVAPADGCGLEAGDQPEFELKAVNTLDAPANVTVSITMTGSTPVSPLSRLMPLPTLLWEYEFALTLRANETKSVNLATNTELPANNVVSITLTDTDPDRKPSGPDGAAPTVISQLVPAMGNGVVVLSFSTVEPAEDPALTAAH